MCTERAAPSPPEAQVAAEVLVPVNSTSAPVPSEWLEVKLPVVLMEGLLEKEALKVSH